jgi:signal transduction histidine kinase
MEAELAGQVAEVRRRTEQLSASRRRLLSARDDERRRLVVALERRVLPHLTTVAARLETIRRPGDGVSGALALPEQCAVETESALDELREITRGLFPTLLERRGLAPALSAHFAKQGSVALTVETSADRRFDFAVESATYLFCVEAANAVGGSADITLAVQSEHVEITVVGTGLRGTEDMQLAVDRVEAIGGEMSIAASPDGVPVLRARVPLNRTGSAPNLTDLSGSSRH